MSLLLGEGHISVFDVTPSPLLPVQDGASEDSNGSEGLDTHQVALIHLHVTGPRSNERVLKVGRENVR